MASKKYTDQEILSAIKQFADKEVDGFETRYQSWEQCHEYFAILYKTHPNKNFESLPQTDQKLAILHLSFYLASWGMYRGSSFTLQYNNSIFKDVITILLNQKYNKLWDLNYQTLETDTNNEILHLIIDIRDSIIESLKPYHDFTSTKSRLSAKVDSGNDNDPNISQTLVTKILLGTVCCCPAYDTYFTKAIHSDCNNFYKDTKVKNLLNYVKHNKHLFCNVNSPKTYPLMKLVDMTYFQLGIEDDLKKYYQKYMLNNETPNSDKLKEIKKSIKQFYYKLRPESEYKLHVSFKHDLNVVEKFIKKYIEE